MIRVVLPHHLRLLARVGAEVQLEVEAPATQRSTFDALEARYPMLRGTIRDHVTHQRRPFVRFFAWKRTCPMSRRTPRCPKRFRRWGQFRFKPISLLWSFIFHRTSILMMSSSVTAVPATSRMET